MTTTVQPGFGHRDPATDASSARPLRLLVADDHRMLRDGLRRTLIDSGIDVVGEAANGEEALGLARELRPDVVLMDITMPVLDGIEATRLIRRQLPGTQVVMLTMHGDADLMTRALQAGAAGYLVKDCSTEDLVSAVRLAGGSEGGVSQELASSMLREARRGNGSGGAGGGGGGGKDHDALLSAREEEVLQRVADGLSLPEVAAQLYISVKTVKNHLASIYSKLDARDRTQAVLRAVRLGIVRLG